MAGVVCRDISVMVRQMTRRIFWQVVMSDTAHLNRLALAEQADTGTVGMAAGLGQPQQQRLIADPLPFGQPRALLGLCVTGRGCSG